MKKTFPYDEVFEIFENLWREKDLKKALKERENYDIMDDLVLSGEPLEFTDVVAGDKCRNGGEYGFYTTYYPTEHPGVYEQVSSTTSDFPCGTGYEGFMVMTKNRYRELRESEEKILADGCTYERKLI